MKEQYIISVNFLQAFWDSRFDIFKIVIIVKSEKEEGEIYG